ncbi:MAG: hypothetical protein NC131_12840 [Roseburia sp.]|nr:hypothetical protein [Roseburia sp.]
MADYLKILDGETLANISVQFDYKSAMADFVGLKLMPMVKTDNMKVAMYNLLKGSEIPVIALVHALDSEARIGDRPNYEEIREELFLIKEKLNQGEELRKKIKDMGMDSTERSIINAIYDDISNLITKVLTGFERRACEVLSMGKMTINENGAVRTVDYKLSDENKINFTAWNDPTHDIFADLASLKRASKNKIVRQIISSTVMGWIMSNDKMAAYAEKQAVPVTEDLAKSYVSTTLGIELIVDDRTFKKSYNETTEYRFFDELTVISLTTRGEVGKTFMTSTPAEDANAADGSYGYVTVSQWKDASDPWHTWTEAEGLGLPVIVDINNTLYLSKITKSTASA